MHGSLHFTTLNKTYETYLEGYSSTIGATFLRVRPIELVKAFSNISGDNYLCPNNKSITHTHTQKISAKQYLHVKEPCNGPCRCGCLKTIQDCCWVNPHTIEPHIEAVFLKKVFVLVLYSSQRCY